MTSATEWRLLEAAGEIFADKGFEKATVREICAKAGANVAAVNYHFGDKLGLYKAVLVGLFRRACQGEVVAVEPVGPPEARLRALVLERLRVCRAMDEGDWRERLISREMAEPTQALAEVVRTAILPLSRRLIDIVRELLGDPPASEPSTPGGLDYGDSREAVLCSMSVMGQVLHHRRAKSVISILFPQLTYSPEQLEMLADHITAFSLAGLEAVRRAREARRTGTTGHAEN